MIKSTRHLLLSELYDYYLKFGPDAYVDINKMINKPKDVNELAIVAGQLGREGLLRSRPGENNVFCVTINPESALLIRAELQRWYHDTKFLVSTAIAIAGWVVALISLVQS